MLLIKINQLMRRQWIRYNLFLATLLFAWTVDANTAIRLIEYQRFAQAAKEAQAQPVSIERETGFPVLAQIDAMMWRGMDMMALGRFYRQGLPAAGLGPNWRLICDEQFVVAADGSARAELAEATEFFRQVKPGEWQTVKAMISTVVRNPDGQYSWTLANGTVRTFARDGWLVKMVTQNGGFQVERDATGRATAVVDLSGNRIRLTVAGGTYREMVDPLGSAWKYGFDGRGRLIKVERPAGGLETYGYQENGMLESVNQGFGTVRLAYDEQGRVISQKVGDRILENRRYATGTDHWEMTVTVAGTEVFSYRRLAGGRTQEYQEPGSGKVVVRFDDRQIPVSILEGAREVYSGRTDAQGRLLQMQVLGRSLAFEYAPAGQVVKIVDGQLNETIERRYDDRARLIEEKIGNRALNRIQWTASGQCAAIILKDGDQPERTMAFDYDAMGHLRSIVSGKESLEFRTNAVGRVVQAKSPAETITMEYDAENQLVAATGGNGAKIAIGYDQRGLPVSWQQGKQKLSLGYDAAGSLAEMTGTAGDVTKFGYDVFDRLCKVETPAGTFATEYDAQGRVASQQMPGGGVERFFYDQDGRLSRAVRSGGAIEFSYGANGKVEQLRGGALGTVQFQYDRNEALAGWKDSRGEQFEIRDGSAVFKNADIPGAEVIRRVVNGKDGSEIAIESKCLPQPIRKIFNAKGKIAAIDSPAGRFDFTYDDLGRRATMKYPNGVVTSFSYTPRGLPIETKIAGKDGTVLELWKQGYDELGRCVSIDNAVGPFRKFAYDDAGRLTLVADGKATELERYEYDAVGNRTSIALAGKKIPVARDAQNRLASQGDLRYAYDAQGRRTGQAAADGRQWRYDYDGLDRLVKAATPTGTVQYGYSLLGTRLWSQKEGGEKRYSLYAGLDKVAEVDAGGRLLAGYVPGLIADEVLASCDKQGNWTYHHRDPLLNLKMLTDAKGASQFRPECTSFGEPLNAATAKLGDRGLFAGTDYDADTGLCYVRARYYDPATAQFVSLDPLGWCGGANPYSYCANDPLQHRDPSGEIPPVILVAAVAGALISGVIDYFCQTTWPDSQGYSKMQTLLAVIAGAVTGGMGVAKGVYYVMKLAFATSFIQNLLGELYKGTGVIKSLVTAALNAVISSLCAAIGKGLEFGIKFIGNWAGLGAKILAQVCHEIAEHISEAFGVMLGGVIDIIQNFIRNRPWIKNGLDSVVDGISWVVGGVTSGIGWLASGVLSVGRGVWNTMGTIGNYLFGNNGLGPRPYGSPGWGSGSGGSSSGRGSTPITLDRLQ